MIHAGRVDQSEVAAATRFGHRLNRTMFGMPVFG